MRLPPLMVQKECDTFLCPCLPMAISDIITGTPKNNMNNTYMIMNAAPPLAPTSVGNLQTLPSPTAEPATANIAPALEAKLELSLLICIR